MASTASLNTTTRTHHCGELRGTNAGDQVTLCGWVHKRRDHGGLIFIDLRDRYGRTQIVFNPEHDTQVHAQAESLRSEFCIAVQGTVTPRPEGTVNPNLSTGEVEVVVDQLTILNASETPPFEISDEKEQSEELRYAYRYLDLRRESQTRYLAMRHQVISVIRDFLNKEDFLEIETPVLVSSTPEGARDFLVPSRLSPGKFYALPQSPQLFKQLLMVSGMDRYYQIARCFRDEDLRSDRQPEFTQLDMEMSFVDEDTIFDIMERMFKTIWQEVLGEELETPFLRLTYQEVMDRFGSDKPDLRYGCELQDLTSCFTDTAFKVFQGVIASGGVLKGFLAPGGASLSTKQIDELIEIAKREGAKGLVPVRWTKEGVVSPVAKHLEPEILEQVKTQLGANVGDLLVLVADQPMTASQALGAVRVQVANLLDLVPDSGFSFLWVKDFPLFHYNEEAKRWDSEHHPFTAPVEEDLPLLETDPGKVRSRSYDLVVNGCELSSGSIRIHQSDVQQSIFRILGLDEENIEERFGFLLKAFRYGAPPHGGIAPGIDRLLALMVGTPTIRDVIAFPKTQKGMDLMIGAPSEVDEVQLRDLSLRLRQVPQAES